MFYVMEKEHFYCWINCMNTERVHIFIYLIREY